MTDKVDDGSKDDKDVDDVITPTIEDKAREMGWRPEEEYEGDNPWIGAEEYVARKPLFDGLSAQSKEIKKLTSVVSKLADHNKKVEATAYDRALAALKQDRVAAIKDGDMEEADRIIEEEVKMKANAPQDDADTMPDDFKEWVEENPWYTDNDELHDYAEGVGMRLQKAGISGKELLDTVEERVKKAFPQHFKSPTIPNGGEGGDGQPKGKVKDTLTKMQGKLTDEERQLGKEFVEMGVFATMDDYIKQLDLKGR